MNIEETLNPSTEEANPPNPGEPGGAEPNTEGVKPPEEKKEETPEEKEEKKKGGFQRRIDKLSQRISERDALIDRLLQAQQNPQKPAEPSKPSEPAGKPRLEDFENQADYLEALSDWKVDNRLKAEKKAQEEDQTRRAAEEAKAEFGKRIASAHETHPDLAELLEEDLPYSPAMLQAIQASGDTAGELIYHLAKNPEECRRIARLAPLQAALEMGQIVATVKTNTKTKPTTKPSAAPAPLTPLKGGGGATPDLNKISSDEEWYRTRNAQRR